MALQRRLLYFHSFVLLYLFLLSLSPSYPRVHTSNFIVFPLCPLLPLLPENPYVFATSNENRPIPSALSRFRFKILHFFIKRDTGSELIKELKVGFSRGTATSRSGLNSSADRRISLIPWANARNPNALPYSLEIGVAGNLCSSRIYISYTLHKYLNICKELWRLYNIQNRASKLYRSLIK